MCRGGVGEHGEARGGAGPVPRTAAATTPTHRRQVRVECVSSYMILSAGYISPFSRSAAIYSVSILFEHESGLVCVAGWAVAVRWRCWVVCRKGWRSSAPRLPSTLVWLMHGRYSPFPFYKPLMHIICVSVDQFIPGMAVCDWASHLFFVLCRRLCDQSAVRHSLTNACVLPF